MSLNYGANIEELESEEGNKKSLNIEA